jgi:hypothetical protein
MRSVGTPRARRESVFRHGDEQLAEQGAAVEQFERDRHRRGDDDRQPEFLIGQAAGEILHEQSGEGLGLRAPPQADSLLHHGSQGQGTEQPQVLVAAADHTANRDQVGQVAERGAHGDGTDHSEPNRQMQHADQPGASYSAEHGDVAGRNRQHLGGRVHDVVDQRGGGEQGPHREPGNDDRQHEPVSAARV